MGERRVYRSREQSIVIALLVPLMGALLVAALTGPSEPSVSETERTVVQVVGFIFLAAWLGIGWFRAAPAAVITDDTGVEVRNPLSTRRFTWDEVAGFSVGSWGGPGLVARVNLADGRSVHAFGISPPNALTRPNNRSAQDLIEALNAELHERRERRV